MKKTIDKFQKLQKISDPEIKPSTREEYTVLLRRL